MSDGPGRALIVRLSSIGDVVHTIPAYLALRRAWPSTALGWAVEPAAAPLVERLPGPATVHVVDTQGWRRRPWRRETWRAARGAIREIRDRDYDVALDFQGLLKSAVLARLSHAPVIGLDGADLREPLAARFYDSFASTDHGPHVVDRGLALAARATGGPPARPEFPELANDEDREAVDARLRHAAIEEFAVVHAAANWSSKAWPERHWAALGNELHRRLGLDLLWVWGPGERPRTELLAAAAGAGNRAAFPTTLPELAALLSRARLFVGVDSAPLHLAVALGAPVVGIFGPTDPRRTGPLDVDDRVVVNRLPCSFCHRRQCPLGTRACLEELPAGRVADVAVERLRRRPATPGGARRAEGNGA